MNWFRKKKMKLKPESDWILVKEIEAQFTFPNIGNTKENFFYYLFEDQFGARKYECRSTGIYAIDINKNHSVYLKKVYPWLKGKSFDDIPTRAEVKFKNKEKLVSALYDKLLDRKENEKV